MIMDHCVRRDDRAAVAQKLSGLQRLPVPATGRLKVRVSDLEAEPAD